MISRHFRPFALERLLSEWENKVAWNLSESGVYPVSLRELMQDGEVLDRLLATRLNYPPTDGLPELRARIAALYPGAIPENVLVTNGCAEANYNSLHALARAGDQVVSVQPNYRQLWGAAHNAGMEVRSCRLREDAAWQLDAAELGEAVTERTKVIALSNPNNPTGHILSEREMSALVAAAERAGAWLLADEVYSGAERIRREPAASLWGRYNRVVATGGLSKAYGLPGLRIGWVVAPPEVRREIWARQDYTTISSAILNNALAAIALSPPLRGRLIERARGFVREGFNLLSGWIAEHRNVLSVVPPDAGAIAFVRYAIPLNSSALCRRLREEMDVLAVPGEHFGVDQHLRLNHGLPIAYVQQALDRIAQFLSAA